MTSLGWLWLLGWLRWLRWLRWPASQALQWWLWSLGWLYDWDTKDNWNDWDTWRLGWQGWLWWTIGWLGSPVTEQSVLYQFRRLKTLLIPGMTETTNGTLPSSAVTFDVVSLVVQMFWYPTCDGQGNFQNIPR